MSQPWHNETFVKRFWAKVPRERDPAKCWSWLGHIGPRGYGKIALGPRGTGEVGAHCAALAILTGEAPSSRGVVDHVCGTRSCVNPYHLRRVSVAENVQHRVGRNSNNTSGHRNVYWDRRRQAWRVQVKIAGRDVHGGYFPATDLDGTISAARELRVANGFPEFWAVGGAKAKELPLVPVVVKRGSGEVSSSPIAQVEQDAATVAQTSEEETDGES